MGKRKFEAWFKRVQGGALETFTINATNRTFPTSLGKPFDVTQEEAASMEGDARFEKCDNTGSGE